MRKPPQTTWPRRTIRVLSEAARLNWLANGVSLVRHVRSGGTLGVIADHKKYQASVRVKTKPRSHVNHLLFAKSTMLRLASNEAGEELTEEGHQDNSDNGSPEERQTGSALFCARFPIVLY